MSPSNVRSQLAWGREYLRRAGIDSFAIDAEVLLRHVSGLSRISLLTEPLAGLGADVIKEYHRCLALRRENMPVAYITNRVEFMSLEFYIDSRALIPRRDTETLVEWGLEMIKARGFNRVLELCTGSGCIAAAVAHYSGANVTATDISEAALEVARINAGAVAELLEGDLFAPVAGRRFDIIMANPPYIRRNELAALAPDVRDYEPVAALDGGSDGLGFYRRISLEAADYLNPGGVIILEIGFDQAAEVREMLNGYKTRIIKDLSGHNRVVTAERNEIVV